MADVKKNIDSKIRYFCGKKFYRTPKGEWVACTSFNRGRYGCPTKTMRVPIALIPYVRLLMERLAVVERVLRNIEGNPYNTSADCLLRDDLMIDMIGDTIDKELEENEK